MVTPRLRRALRGLSVLAVLWTLVVLITGGGVLDLGVARLSSRNPTNPALVALVSALLSWALAPSGRRLATFIAEWTDLARIAAGVVDRVARNSTTAPALAALAAAITVALGLLRGVPVAGGSDSYGYVSQAHLWATGTLVLPEPLMERLADLVPPHALVPLGYVLAPEGPAIVPMYPPGLPMLMAVFERAAGRDAVFLVVPLLGGVAVWATYLMGRRLAGPAVGASAAILLAASPPFLVQLMFAESDVPVAAWWALALALLMGGGSCAAGAAGLAVGAAILTRPNLVPLTIVPAAVLVLRAFRDRSSPAVRRVVAFAVAPTVACAVVAALNLYWYGSPVASGYGALDPLFGWVNLWPNLARYPRWLMQSHTPVIAFALAGPLVLARSSRPAPARRDATVIASMWLCFAAAVVASYLFYVPWDDWRYLRFLMPALPPLLVLTSVTIVAGSRRLPRPLLVVAPALAIGLVAWHGFVYAAGSGAFHSQVEMKYETMGEYVARHVPERAAILAAQHSGSVRHYSGRVTIRYDLIPPAALDPVIARLRGLGYQPYILLEPFEEEEFRQRFRDHSVAGALDWPPVARLHDSGVALYDLSDRLALLNLPPRQLWRDVVGRSS